MDVKRGSWVAVVAFALIAPLAVAGCSATAKRPEAVAPDTTTGSTEKPVPVAEQITMVVTPAPGAKDVPASAEITARAPGATLTTVALREAGGAAVAGALRADGSAWVPGKPLKYNKGYEASVTAVDKSGQSHTSSTTFTTMRRPTKHTGTGLYLFDGNTYGVAMPVVVEFSPGIKKKDRAGVQKRMFVTTSPSQPGTWSWMSTGTQAFYRAPDYWKTGTNLTVRIALGGHPTGDGRYGDQDRVATVKIGRSLVMSVENKTKRMTVVEGGKVIRTMPVSLGKPSTPSSSGTMVVMDKLRSTVFDTRAEMGAAGYVINIEYAQRLTWSGQYIHSAPWSVGDQGHRNVSHGCVNVSPGNARWLFGKTLIGDPVTVHGTGDKLVSGNGWTAWDLSWKDFAKGSALPVSPELASHSA